MEGLERLKPQSVSKSRFVAVSMLTLLFLSMFASLTVPSVKAPVIFSDGFESGDFSAWTSTAKSGDATLEVSTAYPHHGSYGMHAKNSGSGATAVVIKDFTAQTTCSERIYVRMVNVPTQLDGYIRFFDFRISGTQRFGCGLMRDGVSGDYKWFLHYLSSGSQTNSYSAAITPSANTWYCLEMKVVISATVGEARLYVDGSEVITATGLNTGSTGVSRTEVGIGGMDSNPPASYAWYGTNYVEVYEDCVVVADTYIGPETTGDTTPPTYSNVGINTTIPGQPWQFSVLWNDNVNVSGFIFGTNNTGVWLNDTWTAFTAFYNSTAAWSNVTKTLNSTSGVTVVWRVWANDTSNNWADTGQVFVCVGSSSYRIYQISGINYIQNATGQIVYNSSNVAETFSTAFSLASPGGAITVSAGTYVANQTVLIQNRSNVKLVFDDGAVLTISDGVDAPVLYLQYCVNCTLYNVHIDGNAAGQTTPYPLTNGLQLYECSNCLIDRAYVTNCKRSGIEICHDTETIVPSGVINSMVTFCEWNGMTLDSNGTYAINNEVSYCSDVGITTYGTGTIITGNYIHDMNGTTHTQANWGIGVEGGGYALIANNIITNGKTGICLSPDAGLTVQSNLVMNNTITNCITGIGVSDSGYDTITHNQISNWGSGYAFGITLYWGQNYIVSENVLINNLNNEEARSIYTYSISNSSIYNNTITANLTIPYSYGVKLEKTNKTILEKNRIQAKNGVIITSDCANNLIYQNDLGNCTQQITDSGQNTTINPPYLETCTLIINCPSIYCSIDPPAGTYNYLNSSQVSITLTPNPNYDSVLNIDGVNVSLIENSYNLSMERNHVVFTLTFPASSPTLNSPTANYRFNPSVNVTFSWTFRDPDAGDSQNAYQLQIGNSDFTTIYLDAGKVSSTSQNTTRTLPSNMTVGVYYWRVKTWDSQDTEGSWSSGRAIIVDGLKLSQYILDLTNEAVYVQAVYVYDNTPIANANVTWFGIYALTNTTGWAEFSFSPYDTVPWNTLAYPISEPNYDLTYKAQNQTVALHKLPVSPFNIRGNHEITNPLWTDADKKLTFTTSGNCIVEVGDWGQPQRVEVDGVAYTDWTYDSAKREVAINNLASSVALFWQEQPSGGPSGPGGPGPAPTPTPAPLPPVVVPPEVVPLVNVGLIVIVVVVVGAYGYSQITQPKKVSQKWRQRQKQTKPVKWKKKSRFEE